MTIEQMARLALAITVVHAVVSTIRAVVLAWRSDPVDILNRTLSGHGDRLARLENRTAKIVHKIDAVDEEVGSLTDDRLATAEAFREIADVLDPNKKGQVQS